MITSLQCRVLRVGGEGSPVRVKFETVVAPDGRALLKHGLVYYDVGPLGYAYTLDNDVLDGFAGRVDG